MRSRFNNTLESLPLDIRQRRVVDKGGIKCALLVLERVDEDEWRSTWGTHGPRDNGIEPGRRKGAAHGGARADATTSSTSGASSTAT